MEDNIAAAGKKNTDAEMRDAVVNDATKFAGGYIDAAITTRSSHSAVNVRQSVCVTGDPGDSIGKALYEIYVNRLTATRAGYLNELDFDLDARLGSPAGASISVDIAAILLDTGTTLPGEHTTIQNAIAAIQNNTRFAAAVPTYMCKPDAGNTAFKHSSNLYDSVGNMEDPANSEILLRIVKNDGTFITANLYKENALTTALDSATDQVNFPTASGWRAMERDAVGKYFFFYKVANDETEETLTVEFGWDEGGSINFQSRSTEIADVHGDLAAILADVTGINGSAMIGTNNAALAATALSTATWTGAKAAFLDENISAAKTLTVAERTAIRKSVCLTGDTADSIGKILYELYINRLTSARATNLDELAAANVPADVDMLKAKAKTFAETSTDTQLTIANGVNEITIKTFDKATYGTGEIKAFKVDLDKAVSGFQTLAAASSTIKLRVYEKIDAANYRLRTDDGASYTWTQGVTTDKVAEIDEISFSEDMQIRAVLSGAPTGTINLPWLCELNKSMEV